MRRTRVTVTGLVQGVGYRYTLQGVAGAEHVSGWVRNRLDGSVEAELAGDDEAVARVVAWMRQGPAGARVADADITELTGEAPVADGFEVRRDG